MNFNNIFLIDADRFFADAFIQKISLRGKYKFSHFTSFEDARDEFLKTPPSLVLIEQKLKGQTGLEVIPMIHSINPDCDIVMVSDQNDISVVEAAYNSGVLKYFRKDILLVDHIEGLIKERLIESSAGWKKLFVS